MKRISIELVPRLAAPFIEEVGSVRYHFPFIETINVPDLRRLKMRSWEACSLVQPRIPSAIPHIRAIDFCRHHPKRLFAIIEQHRFEEVLVIGGDPPSAFAQEGEETATTLDLIAALHHRFPTLRIYAALDPYRQGVQAEIEYAQEKLAAGACGFFTQPFFDLRLAEIFYEQLGHIELFWGVSPILTAKSESYWRKRNQAFFPRHFEPSMPWNQQFGREMLRFAQQTNGNLYFMPIKVDVIDYLAGIFADQIVLPTLDVQKKMALAEVSFPV
ncbi:MAG: methylenetetrahydrofolate reductase [Chloroflexota bacterium]